MNLALVYCWKEWRAQRGILIAYTLLVHACLCIGLSMAPTHYWLEERFGVHALTWFVTVGVIGVVAFVAPGLVRAEFGQKDDQFVRRLPGALWPAFTGKLLFFVLAAALLPLLGLLVGELFVTLQGNNWHGLYRWGWDGEIWFDWPPLIVGCGQAMLLLPWVWAIGTWLPGGRMSLGGTILFVLLVGLGIAAVLRQSPNIENGIAWQGWLWAVAPAGFVVALVSWCKGRRGGGPLRSVRFGLATAAVVLLSPAGWLADRAWRYHHPDLQQLARLEVRGLSPDGRFALADGATHEDWATVPLRIDLSTGEAEQLAGVYSSMTLLAVRPFGFGMYGQQRYWCLSTESDGDKAFDLVTGRWQPIDYEAPDRRVILPESMQQAVFAERRATTPFRAPGGRRVWIETEQLCMQSPDGSIERAPWSQPKTRAMLAAGHGAHLFGAIGANGTRQLFDFTSRSLVTLPRTDMRSLLVAGRLLCQASVWQRGLWHVSVAGSEPVVCEALRGADVLGLFDDERVLVCRTFGRGGQQARLFLYDPATEAGTDIVLPEELQFGSVQVEAPMHEHGSLLSRDPLGRVWLRCSDGKSEAFALVDPSLRVTTVLPHPRDLSQMIRLLSWDDLPKVIVQQGERIVRIDVDSDQRTVLFPRR